MSTATTTASSVYEQLGVTPIINAQGNQTVRGGSTPSATVQQAMIEANRYYVDMQELLERSGKLIADLLGCEAAYVTPGAAAAIALGTAACITGMDMAKIERLPDTTGLKNEVLIQHGHHYHYERAATIVGAHLKEVGDARGTSLAQFEAALGPQVANVLFPAHLDGEPGTLPLTQVIAAAHAKGVPVLVDAAGRVFPLEKFKSYTRMGADLVAYGAKYIGGLNASGILCGRRDLVEAAVPQGFIGFETVAYGKSFGRPLKLDRQTIVAVVVALREWLSMDHDARLRLFEQRLNTIAEAAAGAPGVTTDIQHGEGSSPRVLKVAIDPTRARRSAGEVKAGLRSGTPGIVVGSDDSALYINPATVHPDDVEIIAERLRALLV